VLEEGDFDARLRVSAMAWLRAEQLRTPQGIRHDRLTEFRFEDSRVPLLNLQRGIWKPALLHAALSIRTVFRNRADERPYDDAPGPEGLLRYKWMGTDPNASDNRAVRRAMEQRLPLIYLVGIARGLYQPVFPVFIEAEEPAQHQFVVSTSAEEETAWRYTTQGQPELAREYLQSVRNQRLHQRVFREQVLLAYGSRCALCELGHRELIDAAHIREDAAGGAPKVTNGIAMCKLHHATFDNLLVGISPDYEIRVRHDLLEEVDGPTLQHSIKQLHGEQIRVPSSRLARPDRELLAERFHSFELGAA
jgi:putative restriction endonuclease